MEILKRSLSAFLALVLVLGMVPVNATAAELEIVEASGFAALGEELPLATATTDATEESVGSEPMETALPTEAADLTTEPTEVEETTEPSTEVTEPEDTEPTEAEKAEEPAADISGTCGENLAWSLSGEGSLIITGTGDMYDYALQEEVPWAAQTINIYSISLPNGLTSIGTNAFQNCFLVPEINIPDSVTRIGDYAFYACNGLTELKIPEHVTQIGKSAFGGCANITEFTLPEGIPNIPEELFNGCNGLTKVNIPESVTSIGNLAFGATSVAELTIPAAVTSIGDNLFLNRACGKITFKGSAPVIAASAFTDMTTEIYYPADNPTWTEEVRQNYGGTITWVAYEEQPGDTCGENLTWVFDEGTGTLTISGTGEMLDYNTADVPWKDYQEQVVKVVVDEGVTSIGSGAFANFSALTQVEIADSVTQMADSVMWITYGIFENCTSLVNVELPENLTAIGERTFQNCTQLESVEISDSVLSIGDAAFRDCSSLKGLELPENLQTMGSYIFDSCTALESVEIPGTVTNMAYYAFVNCTSLQKITLPDDLEDPLLWGMFSGCTSLTEADIGNLTGISMNMFEGCTSLTKVEFSDQLEAVYAFAFSGCTSLKTMSFPETLDILDVGAFDNCTALEEIYFTGDAFFCNEPDPIIFQNVVAKIYYPADNPTWTEAVRQNYGGTLTWEAYGNPELSLNLDNQPAEASMTVDMMDHPALTFTAQRGREVVEAVWASSNTKIAEVFGGEVRFIKPGEVTITATSGDEQVFVDLTLIYADTAKKLTASVADMPKIELQPEQTVQMTVSGDAQIPAEKLIFTSSNTAIASVNENGQITGGSKIGTAKITAAIAGDPLKRKVTLNVKVISAQITSVTLEPEEIKLKKDSQKQTFVITPSATWEHGEGALTSKSLKWTSSDTKLATVKTNPDGSAIVTVAANKVGTAVITATANDLRKNAGTMSLLVYDHMPRLESAKIELNPKMATGTDLGLNPGWVEQDGQVVENAITGVTVNRTDLEVVPVEGRWVLKAAPNVDIRNGTIKTQLKIVCADQKEYYLDIQVAVKSTIPAMSIIQENKMDLFYTDSQTDVTVTAKGAVVEKVELSGNEDFCMDEARVIHFTEALQAKFAANPKYKPSNKAVMSIYLEGYAHPVVKNVVIAITTSKMNLTTEPSSSTVNVNRKFHAEAEVSFSFYDKAAKQTLPLTEIDEVTLEGYELEVAENAVSLNFQGEKKTTLVLKVQKENWMYPVEVKHTVNVTTKDPTAKLTASTVTLNSNFPELGAETTPVLSTGNLTISDCLIYASKAEHASLFDVSYDADSNTIQAAIKEGAVPRAGSYAFTVTPVVPGVNGDVQLKSVSLKITVTDKKPEVTVSTKDKLNAIDPDSTVTFSVTKIANSSAKVEAVAIKENMNDGYLFDIVGDGTVSPEDQRFSLRLNAPEGEVVAKKTYKVVFTYTIGGKPFDSKPVSVSVTQGKLTIDAQPSYIRAQGSETRDAIRVVLRVADPVNAQMELIEFNGSKTTKDIIRAYDGYELTVDDNTGDLILKLFLNQSLTPGKTYKLVLNITPVGNTKGTKSTVVTLNIEP